MKRLPPPGSTITLVTIKGTFTGMVIQRPKLLLGNALILKLENGYNIGILPENIKKCTILKQAATKTQQLLRPHATNQKLPTIAILSTGGTISSKVDYITGGVSADLTAEDFTAMIPELKNSANITAKKVCSLMTEDVTPNDWLTIAKHVTEELPKADGIIVTTGTDMMHLISAALSYLLVGINKPVIITGAQRSIDRGSSDAYYNLQCALRAALQGPPGVYICMHETMSDTSCLLLHGAKTRKMHTSRRDAFRSINHPPIARVTPSMITLLAKNPWPAGERCTLQKKVATDVALITVHPGMPSESILSAVKRGAKVLVIAATALGHVPTNGKGSIIPALEYAKKKGALIVITTQTLYGRVHPHVYANLRTLSLHLGALYLEELTPETAYVKAIVTGARAKTIQERAELLATPLINEFTLREQPGEYLS